MGASWGEPHDTFAAGKKHWRQATDYGLGGLYQFGRIQMITDYFCSWLISNFLENWMVSNRNLLFQVCFFRVLLLLVSGNLHLVVFPGILTWSLSRIPGISHNFWFPVLCCKRCVAPMLRRNFCFQNFRGRPFEEEGSEDNLATTKVPRRTANPANFAKFLAPRVVLPTLRGAHAFQKFPFPKFSRAKLDEEGSKDTPRIPGIYHNFWFPAFCFEPCVAPMFR